MAKMLMIGLALAVCSGMTSAFETQSALQDNARVEALVAQLGSETFDARDSATQELAAGPVRWLPILVRHAQTSADPEVTCRAFSVVHRVIGERVVTRMPDAAMTDLKDPKSRFDFMSKLRDVYAQRFWSGKSAPEEIMDESAPIRCDSLEVLEEKSRIRRIPCRIRCG